MTLDQAVALYREAPSPVTYAVMCAVVPIEVSTRPFYYEPESAWGHTFKIGIKGSTIWKYDTAAQATAAYRRLRDSMLAERGLIADEVV